MKINLRSHAKINLALSINYKRSDGYHDISTIMQEIDLCDEIFIKKNLYNRPKYEINFKEETRIQDYLIDDYSKKILQNTNIEKIKYSKINKFNYWNEFALKNNLNPIFKNIENENICPWCCPVYSNSKEETVYWYKWGWKNGIFVFSWPNLIDKALENRVINKRRERLICFSTN